jgi:GWxTD domain-containing protein
MFWTGLCSRVPVASLLAGAFSILIFVVPAEPQRTKSSSSSDPATSSTQGDPLQRPIDKQQATANRKHLTHDFGAYKKWLDEDAIYIITPEEREAFKQLSNDEERDQFIETFWLRRDPTPDTLENEYKEEHYRRIAYANERFGAGVPGWKTDRGRIYIIHGAPDEIESHPSGGTYDRSPQEGGNTTTTFPFERWRYRYVEDVGQEVVVEFVDTCMCGDYHRTMDPNEKDALAHTPMGQPLQGVPFTNGYQQFENMDRFFGMSRAPKIRFKDLSEAISHTIHVNTVPFDVLANFVRVTGDTVLVPIAIQVKNRDITFANTQGVEQGTLNIFGRVTTLSGRVAQTFEDTVQVDVPHDLLPKLADNASIYGKSLPLTPGHYRLDIVVKDVNGDRVGSWYHSVIVPAYDPDRLATSSLMVADRMERVPSKDFGTGSFVLGDMFVRPRVPNADGQPAHFKRDQKIAFWMQVYNLSTDDKTHKPSATMAYDILSESDKRPVIHTEQSTSELGTVGGQITLQKTLSASDLKPGSYTLRIRVSDNLSNQIIEPTAAFVVE